MSEYLSDKSEISCVFKELCTFLWSYSYLYYVYVDMCEYSSYFEFRRRKSLQRVLGEVFITPHHPPERENFYHAAMIILYNIASLASLHSNVFDINHHTVHSHRRTDHGSRKLSPCLSSSAIDCYFEEVTKGGDC